MSTPLTDPRARAAKALVPLLMRQGSLSSLDDSDLEPRDRRLVRALCFGVCRTLPQLEALAKLLLSKPFKQRDFDVQALLLLGLYQLLYMRVPSHAAVGETAGAARLLGKGWATRVLNACLRRFQREQATLEARIATQPEAVTLHPAWLLKALRTAWPEQINAIIQANNTPAPMTLRVNLSRITRDDYQALLQEADIAAEPCAHSPAGIRLIAPVDVNTLPLFSEGGVSVQDEAAQLAAPLLYASLPKDVPLRILDACSAPGGKSAHLLELAAADKRPLELVSLDSDAQRLTRVKETLARLNVTAENVSAEIVHADASQQDWWDGRPFDAILLDAPCSGTGVIRRHPDIKLLRTAQDIVQLSALQQRILHTLWPMLAQGGHMLYATCSVMPAENAQQISTFMADQPDARGIALDVSWGIDRQGTRQRLPGEDDADGFFYALMTRLAD
ncbi:16S rRNA (cytosine(967)-C(5))-methyltransferase RsmB [Zymobacter palmae]|uniref:16S rRNA (cytosine(967)-C(5))-methyltransferase n=1 Tax=Zymobacter palmae TaxID=33074 RepID=A0A348HHM0_9GAMM|nr:16S rRNA (cytosine(967)-C(5))-methyltransferase RsmB [Zymobacter palmae]BBG31122.1 tRNA and rRNA cytosine-C5-methylases [Zymobacter palmae]